MITFPRLSKPRQKINLLIAALFVAVQLPLFLILSSPTAIYAAHEDQDLAEHCPDHEGNTGKVQASGEPAAANQTVTVDGQEINVVIDGKTVSFFDEHDDPISVEFCMKAGDLAGGKQTGTTGTVTWLNHGGQIPDISYVVVYGVMDQENDKGTLKVNKAVLDVEGNVTGGNEAANTLGFRWGYDTNPVTREMGTSVDLAAGNYEITENSVAGYQFIGYYMGEGSCKNDDLEEDKTLPINVSVTTNNTTDITLCNQQVSSEETLGSITIVKDARPDNIQAFVFSATGLGEGNTEFTLDDDGNIANERKNSVTYDELKAGEYSFTEQTTEGWTLTSIACADNETRATYTGATVAIPEVTVNLGEGDNVTCTFVNTQNMQGVVLGDTDEVEERGAVLGAATGGQGAGAVLGAQTEAPVGGVAAGFGGATAGASLSSLAGLATSLSAVGYGVASLRKRQ